MGSQSTSEQAAKEGMNLNFKAAYLYTHFRICAMLLDEGGGGGFRERERGG